MSRTKKNSRKIAWIYDFMIWVQKHLYFMSFRKAAFQRFINNIGFLGEGAYIESLPIICPPPQKLFVYENSKLSRGAKFFISKEGSRGNCIIKKNTIVSAGVTIVTNVHNSRKIIGQPQIANIYNTENDSNMDVVIEEDVWIGANVTILPNVTIGRGALIGAGSVIRKNVPAYSVVIGNPAKVVSFNYSKKEILQHEELLYTQENRISIEEIDRLFLLKGEIC